jgi:hypothetical protein
MRAIFLDKLEMTNAEPTTVIDGSYPAASFPKFLFYNVLPHNLQGLFGKFPHQKASPYYVIQSESAMQLTPRLKPKSSRMRDMKSSLYRPPISLAFQCNTIGMKRTHAC